MGIRYVGNTVAKKLAQNFKTIDALKNATLDELVAVDEIGERIAQSVVEYFRQPENIHLIYRLQEAGLNFKASEEEKPVGNQLEGKVIVVSGVFTKFSREELKKSITLHGGKVGSSISGKTDFLVAGDNMGPSKLKKAQDLNVEIISEDDFIELIK